MYSAAQKAPEFASQLDLIGEKPFLHTQAHIEILTTVAT